MSQQSRRRAPQSSSAVKPADKLYAAVSAVERYSGLNAPKGLYRQPQMPHRNGVVMHEPPVTSMHAASLLNTLWLNLSAIVVTVQSVDQQLDQLAE